jgi:hypothetical protein
LFPGGLEVLPSYSDFLSFRVRSQSKKSRLYLALRVVLLLMALFPASVPAQVSVVTEHYDNARTGANLAETTLNTSNVNVGQFGKLYSYAVDGSIYAQPLYVPNVAIPGQGTYNVLYVVTMNDVIYALNADSNAVNGGLLWSVDLRNPSAGVTPIPITDIVGHNNGNIVGNVGIESTPVIDNVSSSPTYHTIYLVARTKEVSGATTNYVARLHALDITSGAEKFGGPVVIDTSVPLVFDPLHENQRSSLALVNGMVLFSWASHEDLNVWYGWIMAYNSQTLAQVSAFCTTPGDSEGGVWMSGRAPAVDSSGNVYYASGNGGWDGVSNFGDSVMKFSTTGGVLSMTDYFTPDDYATLASDDLDLGSGGPMLIPGTNLLVHGGKTSIFYLMNLSNLGHEQSGNGQIVQNFSTGGDAEGDNEIHAGPVFWNRTSGAGPTMYVWANYMPLQGFQFNGSTFNATPISESTIVAPQGDSGGVLTLSANGSTAGTGIVWSSMPLDQDADVGTVQGVLRAYDANNLATELWDSTMDDSRDDMGIWPKYSPPTVANGKVYMASFSNLLNVYGLLPVDFGLSITPPSQSLIPGDSMTYSLSTVAQAGFVGTVSLTVSGLPPGATASLSPSSIVTPGSSTLTITSASTTPLGTYTLTITGTSGTLTHTLTAVLLVEASGGSAISQSGWTLLFVDSQETVCGNYAAVNAFDGNPATFWHTQYCPSAAPLPHQIQINLGASYNLTGFTYLPRQDGCSNGWISQYQIYVSTDGVSWGSPVSSGTFNYGTAKFGCPGASVPTAIQVLFPPTAGQYIELVGLSEVNDNQYSSAAEINVLASNATPVPTLSSLTLIPPSVVGGSPSQGTVTLTSAAPASGITVTLSSSNTAAATVPGSVTIASGATSATFTVTTSSVTTSTSSTISATYNGFTETAALTVATAAVVSSVTLNPSAVVGGNSSQGTVTLSAAAPASGATVTLTSSNPAAATVPTSVTVAASATSTTFTITTNSVTTSTSSVISATYGATQTATLGVQAASTTTTIPQAGWTLLSVDSQETECGNYAAVNAFDGNPATFWHTQYCPTVAALPHQISIDLGATYSVTGFTYLPRQDGCSHGWISQYQFYLSTDGVNWGSPVASGTFNYGTATIACPGGSAPPAIEVQFVTTSAQYVRLVGVSEVSGNQYTSAAEINVLASSTPPAPALSSLTLNPASVVGGSPSQGTVTLTSAPLSGLSVGLSSSNTAAATVPTSVTVAAGKTSATFSIATSSVSTSTTSAISASYNGVTQPATLTVAAATAASSLTLNPSSVVGGNSSQGTVTLTAAAPAPGATVTLTSGNTAAATVPASVTVASGATSATFTITTSAVTTSTTSTISGTYGGVTAPATLTITLAPVVSSVTLSPATVVGGSPAQATVTLSAAAPAAGATVTLTSSNTAAATVPSAVNIASGATSATFTVTSLSVSTSTSSVISAAYGGSTQTATLTVQASGGTIIPQSGWSLLSVDSQETTCGNYKAVNAFDGNPATFWHTQWCPSAAPLPHQISINLGASYSIKGLTYLPRQDGCSHGWISEYQIYVSTDGVNWGSPVASGTFSYGTAKTGCPGASVPAAIQVSFAATTGQYVKLEGLSEVTGNPYTSAAEINVLH